MDRQRRQRLGYVLALIGALGLCLAMLGNTNAQASDRCFAEVESCIQGQIRAVWEQTGLALLGFPLTAELAPPGGGPAANVQWFERARIELHPGNAAPYNVLLGRVGAERLAQLGRDWSSQPPSQPQQGCRFFAETGRNVCEPFLAFWESHGRELDGSQGVSDVESLALFGLPLTEAQEEQIDGQTYTVQWFERARLELHPENPAASRVLLGRLGAELIAGGGGAAGVVAAPGAPTSLVPQPTATATTPTPTRTRSPQRRTAEPTSEAVVPTEEPAPTSTRAVPTATTAPPTNTRVPPTPTPTNPFQPPGQPTVPGGFADNGGLPLEAVSARSLEEYDAAVDTPYAIGSLLCFEVSRTDGEPITPREQTFTVTGEDGGSETGSVFWTDDTSSVRWRWVPLPSLDTGIYTVTTTLSDTLGTGYLTGTLTLERRPVGSGGSIVVTRTDSRVALDDINNCASTIDGERGDTFGIVLTGFVGESVDLYLYSDVDFPWRDCPGDPGIGGTACYMGKLATVPLDGQGQAYLELPTQADYPAGNYIVLTAQQASVPVDPGSGLAAVWYQRFTLR